MKSTIMILLSLIAASSYARLGETERMIQQRYGEPVLSPGQPMLTHTDESLPSISAVIRKICYYKASDMIVVVDFLNGRSEREVYSKIDKDGNFIVFQFEELMKLLQVNSYGSKWTAVKGFDYDYVTLDKDRMAILRGDTVTHSYTDQNGKSGSYSELAPTFYIYTKKWSDLIGTRINAAVEKSISAQPAPSASLGKF